MIKSKIIPWNKGIKTGIVPKTAFKKGHKFGNRFKKGHKPWNTGIKRYPDPTKHPSWKGGEFTDKFGYVYEKQSKHPFAMTNGYVRKHRLVMEKHLKRFLSKEEHVHHINGNTSDNRIENLMLFPNNRAHVLFHSQLHRTTQE